MNIEKINQWLMLAANIGVLAGIFFLGVELQQNTNMMKAQTRDSLSSKLMDWQMMVADSDSLAEIYLKGNEENGWENVTAEDFRYRVLVQSNLRLWENEWYQYQMGLFDEDEFTARTDRWRGALRLAGYRAVWEVSRRSYSPSFRDLLDSYINEQGN